jgi:hypothetical protein
MISISVNVQTQDALRALDTFAGNMIAAERNTLEDLRQGIRSDLGKVTATWEHKPVFFEQKLHATGGTLFQNEIRITTNDAIFRFVDEGTRPHMIRPRSPGGVLAFQTGYTRKTYPGYITSVQGGKHGPLRFARAVRHPGTKPRRFTETITRKWQATAGTLLERRVRMALSGMNMGTWK